MANSEGNDELSKILGPLAVRNKAHLLRILFIWVDKCCHMRNGLNTHFPEALIKLDVAHWFFRVLEFCLSSHPGYRSLTVSVKEVMYGTPTKEAYLWKSPAELSQKLLSTMLEYQKEHPGLITPIAEDEWRRQIRLHVLGKGNCLSMEGIKKTVPTLDGKGKATQGTSAMEGGNMQLRRVLTCVITC